MTLYRYNGVKFHTPAIPDDARWLRITDGKYIAGNEAALDWVVSFGLERSVVCYWDDCVMEVGMADGVGGTDKRSLRERLAAAGPGGFVEVSAEEMEQAVKSARAAWIGGDSRLSRLERDVASLLRRVDGLAERGVPQSVPRSVPREPTVAMLAAGSEGWEDSVDVAAIWRAMWDASAATPVTPRQHEE